MGKTPHEIRTLELPRSVLGGYQRREADEVLDEAADSLATVTRERDALRERVDALEEEASSRANLETMLRSTLVSAEQASQETKEQARRESDLIVQEAHAEARRVTREAAAERRALEEETAGIQARLKTALDSLGAPPSEQNADGDAQASEPTSATLGEDLESRLREVVA